MTGLGAPALALLALLGLISGVGITAIGPGGVLATIALFTLTDLTPAQVAGTAIVTHVATGALGAAVYTRSGHLRDPGARRVALALAGGAAVGAPAGVLVNAVISARVFGLLLGLFVAGVAALLWQRDRRDRRRGRGGRAPGTTRPAGDPQPAGRLRPGPAHPPTWLIAVLGVGVATASAMFGIGGPMLTVPLLVALRMPVLSALAAAQVQSVIIASAGAAGYLAQGAVDWPLAAVVGVPELAGVLIGWVIARALPTRALTWTLIAALLILAPYLALHG